MNLGASISSNDWKGHGSAGSSLKWALIRSFKGRTAKEEEVLESSKNFGGQAEDDLRRSGRGGGGGSSSNNIWSATTTSRLEILSGLRRTRSWRRCTREDNALYSQLYHIFQHRKNGCLFQLNSAKVIGVGPGKVSKNGNVIPVCVKEGDTVLLPEYGGTSVKLGEDDLEKMGALEWQKVVKEHQGWRLITCIWLHAGVIHLLANMLSLVFIGIRLEQEFGFARIGTVYLVSAFGGSVLSALFNQNGVSVGASGALFGLLGAMLSELITNWTIYASKFAALVTLLFIIVVNLAFGLLPHVDNFAHIGGFISGFFLGFVFLMRPQFGWVNRKIIPPGYDVNSVVKSKHNAYQYILGLLSLILLIVGTQGSNIITCSFRVQT